MAQPKNEPRLRIVLSPKGIERVEAWGQGEADQKAAVRLYFGLTKQIEALDAACVSKTQAAQHAS
jgi:hypothetical protein